MRKTWCRVAVALALVACSERGDDGEHGADAPSTDTTVLHLVADETGLYPFPNDAFTVRDDTTSTGRRVALDQGSMPVNAQGMAIDATRWNELDGFSPGAAILVQIPDLDLEASGAAPVTDIGRSLDDDAPVVLLDADTGERLAHWVETDSYADATAGEVPTTFVRPAAALPEGHRIVVGMRGLVDTSGAPVEPTDTFRALRDDVRTDAPAVEDRRDAMEAVFDDLEAAGVDRGDLQLAWDFTVGSAESIAGPLLHMRDDAFATLGDAAPAFTVTTVEPSGREGLATHVTGTYEVPLYLDGGGAPGSSLVVDVDGVPVQQGTYTANFECVVPTTASASTPAGTGVYGHGLLGAADQVPAATQLVASAANIVFCGTDLIGMSESDTANAVAIINDFSRFHTLADRLLQGHLNTLFLGRLLRHPDGLRTDPAFQDAGQPLIGDELVYYGISQGGIMGSATTAVAQDWTRAVLDVPAIDYGLLLDRSVDFDPFRDVMFPAYPSAADRALVLQLAQMLWDRGEGNGYAQHLTTEPYPDTPSHRVLIHAAFGDHQVTNLGTEFEARTIGASVHRPVLADGRGSAVEAFFGVPEIESYPFDGPAAVVLWDSGTPRPPDVNQPNREGEDPHGDPRQTPAAVQQIAAFLTTGDVIDVCGPAPCAGVPDPD